MGDILAIQLNAHSLINKDIPVEALALDYDAHILFITESWIPENASIKIRSYKNVIFSPRKDTEFGRFGGVAVYIKENCGLEIQYTDDLSPTPNCQLVHVRISSVNFYCCYRSPSQDPIEMNELSKQFQRIKGINSIILGDFNLPSANWSEATANTDSETRLIRILLEQQREQLVTEPTFTRSNNILDICVASPGIVQDVKVLKDNWQWSTKEEELSDHFPVLCKIQVPITKNLQTKIVPMYDQFQREVYQQILASVDWYQLNWEDLDCAAQQLIDIILDAFERALPKKVIKIDTKGTGFSEKTCYQIEKVRRLRGLNHKSLKSEEKHLKKLLDWEAERKRSAYVEFLSRDKKNIYATFDRRQYSKEITCLVKSDGTRTDDPQEMADMMNEFLTKIFVPQKRAIIDWTVDENTLVHSIDINEETLKEVIKEIKPKKSAGPDGISNFMIKAAGDTILFPLAVLLRKMLNEGKVPQQFRLSKVICIPKKGSPCYLANLRGISLPSNIDKLIERMAKNTIYNALLHKFDPCQFGFKKKSGCLDNMFAYFNEVYGILERQNTAYVLLLDCQKCFDTLPHHIILQKLKQMGVSGRLGEFCQQWLYDRKQYVDYKGAKSKETDVSSGSVQGSNLGPIFFSCLNNDSSQAFKYSKQFSFCDDMKVIFEGTCAQDLWKFQSDLTRLAEFLEEVGLQINYNKTQIIKFGRLEAETTFLMNNRIIHMTRKVTDLGILVNDVEFFGEHRKNVVAKMSRACNATKMMMRGATFAQKCFVYKTYLMPANEYLSELWSSDGVTEELDRCYREFFAGCRPTAEEANIIPDPPSIRHFCRLVNYLAPICVSAQQEQEFEKCKNLNTYQTWTSSSSLEKSSKSTLTRKITNKITSFDELALISPYHFKTPRFNLRTEWRVNSSLGHVPKSCLPPYVNHLSHLNLLLSDSGLAQPGYELLEECGPAVERGLSLRQQLACGQLQSKFAWKNRWRNPIFRFPESELD